MTLFEVKKGDQAGLLSKVKLLEALEDCEEFEGDVLDKGVVLLKGLIKNHPFKSGNRRTAFIATKKFLAINRKRCRIKDDPKNANVMQGIREDFYSHDEIKEWIINGKIRTFRR